MMKRRFLYFIPVAAAVFVASCNDGPKNTGLEYMPDMYRSPSYETYSSNPVFKDSMTAQQPVANTIARGDDIYAAIDRMPYPYPDNNEGYEKAGLELKSPLEHNEANLTEGKRLYENYCTHCHGATGQGDGLVVQRNGPKPFPYNDANLRVLPEGKMFHVTQYGKNMMGSHASQLTATQRWKIIQYVQTLQKIGAPAAATADTAAAAPAKKG